jgi:DNA-binding NtrC family response regulator
MPEKILVIDDEVDMLMLLRMIIEDNTEYGVETTNNPSEALTMIKDRTYDLIISDLKMPGIDGLELFNELKEISPETPLIIITAYGSQEAADEAFRSGVTDFIAKPFRKDSILFTIKKSLELSRLKKENIALKKKLSADDQD